VYDRPTDVWHCVGRRPLMHMYDVFPSDGEVDAVTFGTGTGGTLAGWSSVLEWGSHDSISISYYY